MATIFKTRGKVVTATRMSVEEVVAAIRERKYEKEVLAFREVFPLVKGKRDEEVLTPKTESWEKDLPLVCFACDYQKRGGELQQVAYNGLVMLEVSNLQDEDMAIGLRFYAGQLPQTMLSFVGADGGSVVIVCKSALLGRQDCSRFFAEQSGKAERQVSSDKEQVSSDKEQVLSDKEQVSSEMGQASSSSLKNFHYNAYAAAQKFYTAQLGVTVDVVEPRLDRACFMSVDAGLFYNPNALPFYVSDEEQLPLVSPFKRPASEEGLLPGRDRYQTQMLVVQHCMTKAFEEAMAIEDEQMWRTAVLTRMAHYCMESGIPKEIAQEVTYYHPDLNRDHVLTERIFDNVYTPKALKRALTKNPETAALRHIPESTLLMMKTQVFMEQNYEFRKNVLTGVPQYRLIAEPYFGFRDVTEEDRNTMTTKALRAGLKTWDRDIKRYIESNDIPLYDPINDYLMQLPEWDGKDRLADFACRVPTDDELWHRHFPLWMRSMVAHWMGKDIYHANALVPLLIGHQGCGKTTFCGIILPPELHAYYNDRVNFRNEYDLQNQLSSNALINVDEFDSVGKTRQALLKYLLSKPNVKLRIPYGKADTRRRRYASFIATTNSLQPLVDPTGSRRFLCVLATGRIDTVTPVDYKQLYAQLLAEIRNGVRYWLTDEETAKLIRHNEQYRQIDSIEEMVQALYRRPKLDEACEEVSVGEIADRIHRRFGINVSQSMYVRIGIFLAQMGCEHRHTHSGARWKVAEILTEN